MKKDPVPPPNLRTGTDRAADFRDKLAAEGLKRYELYVSDATRREIKEIAAREGVTTGVAAEALLKLGIESYHARAQTDAPQFLAEAVAAGPVPVQGLARYTERSEIKSAAEAVSRARNQSAGLTGNLIAAAQRRRKKSEP